MNVLSLFDGMSCCRLALERAGMEVSKYYAAEIDKHAIKVAQANFPDTVQLGSVTDWQSWDIDWESITAKVNRFERVWHSANPPTQPLEAADLEVFDNSDLF